MQEGKCTGDEQKQVTERAGRAGGEGEAWRRRSIVVGVTGFKLMISMCSLIR